MGIKRISQKPVKASPTKVAIPVLTVKDDLVHDFNNASSRLKEADADLKERRAPLVQAALSEIFSRNIANPTAPITSLRLVDQWGNAAVVSFTAAYSGHASKEVPKLEKAFDKLGLESSDWVQEVYKGKLSTVAFKNKKGDFNDSLFRRFIKGVAAVAEDLGLNENPISLETEVIPKPAFHVERWDIEDNNVQFQFDLFKAVPNTVTATPAESEE